ncbi:protein SPMIP1-like [Menidia menidia]
MSTRLAWMSRHAKICPSRKDSREPAKLPKLPVNTGTAPPADTEARPKTSAPRPPPPPLSTEQHGLPPLMRPVSPQTRQTLYQDASQPVRIPERGRSLYLRRRGHIRPEEKFDFPLLSSWEYGWRLGDHNLDYRTPSWARLSVVRSTFYARNGAFSVPSATDTVG